VLRHVPQTGPHFLYVDDGTFPANMISGYRITTHFGLVATPGSPYLTGGSQGVVAYGANQIATSPGSSGRQPCVFHTDEGSGLVESFAVATTGALTEVSMLFIGTGSSFPADIHASPDGRYVYVAVWGPPSFLDVLTVGSGCHLTLASSLKQATARYYSIALLGTPGLLAVDNANNKLDVYRITNGTHLTLVSSTPSQLASPEGAAAGALGHQEYVFNGLTTGGPGEVEAHTVNGQGEVGPVPGSPAEDPNSRNGPYVFYDASHQQVIESEEDDDTLGVYGAQAGAQTLLSQATLPEGYGPTAMTEVGATLYVVANFDDVVDSCAIGAGVLTCALAGTLPYHALPEGIDGL
jgi:6-phosphogluconolactonase (cycloisomerase 2 family)